MAVIASEAKQSHYVPDSKLKSSHDEFAFSINSTFLLRTPRAIFITFVLLCFCKNYVHTLSV